MDRNKLVIFGCGYVGREVAMAAVSAGHEVWIHSRNPDSLASVIEVPADRRIVADLHSEDWHEKLAGDWDVVINLVSSAGGGLDGYRSSYIDGNRSIRNWAAHRKVKRFIYSSATSVYPQTDGSWVGEEDVPDADQLSPNGRILRQAECEILESNVFNESVILRLGGIYGPGRHLYLNSLIEGCSELPGDGSAHLNLIYLKDIRDAILELAGTVNLPGNCVLNLVDDAPTPKQEIVDWLAGQINRPTLRFNPEITGVRGVRRGTSAGMPDRKIRNERIKQVLGWSPAYPTYRDGYADILESR